MSPEPIQARPLRARLITSLPARLAAALGSGLVMGCAAQVLTAAGGLLSTVGMSAALWVNLGYLLVFVAAGSPAAGSPAAGSPAGRDRVAWLCISAAGYLYAWLLAYHALYWLLERAPGWTVWAESRAWVAAVAPACVLLGCMAAAGRRPGVLGDVCLGLPLAWSLAEGVLTLPAGWGEALLLLALALPVAAAPLFMGRGRLGNPARRGNPVTVIVTALVGGAALVFLAPYVERVFT